MSSRPLIKPHSVITDGSMAGNITSDVTIIQQVSVMSYGYSWAGTSPVGTMSVQVSNDYSIDPGGAVLNAGTWTTMDLIYGGATVTSVPVTGNTGNGMIDLGLIGTYAIRTVYTRTSGTGTLQCKINAKVA